MPGMNSGLNSGDPTLVAAFRSALLHQLGIVTAIFILLLLACWTARNWRPAASSAPPPPPPGEPAAAAEPKARRLLRISFGIVWVIDGVLQAQPQMAGGLVSRVIAPTAAASPHWVQRVVNFGGTVWSFHPVQAAASAVWIQAGLGLWLIAAETGWGSRLAGLASAAWGLMVWVFGESFGGVFAPGLTWLSGAPGAVLLYVVAGVLIALPFRAWARPRLGRLVLVGIGLFWAGLAVLQAWPGRGFWQGATGTLTGMVQSMASASQPYAQAAMVSAFASFTSAHGFAVNLFAVIMLGLLSLAFLSGQPRLLRVAVPIAVVFCLADWALVQDFGVPGGLGTDPNSMVPWVLLLWGAYLAVVQAPDMAERAVASPSRTRFSRAAVRAALRPSAPRPAALRQAMASASARSVTAVGAVGVILVGAAPMAAASADHNADPIIARSIAGGSLPLDLPAPGFRLVSQSGQTVSLASLRGKVTLLTFLDPVCADCPVITQVLKEADTLLGASGNDVEFVAIVANATHFDRVTTQAFVQQEGLATVPNWLFLTGPLAQLQQVWAHYGINVPVKSNIPANDGMGMHSISDIAFVIDKAGRIRQEMRDDPRPSTASTRSSFAVLLSDAARQTLAQR
jgi:cytochrome oxidase Cu insertion factor (SCO1/SenC/PrrC family)